MLKSAQRTSRELLCKPPKRQLSPYRHQIQSFSNVPNVSPMLDREYRRSYVLWKEFVAPLIVIEFVSGNGAEERDATPPSETEKAGKFWVYEQAIRIPFYVIFDERKDNLEAYHLVNGRYVQMQPNDRGHYPITPMGVELGLILENGVSWLRWWDESGSLLLTGDERAISSGKAFLQKSVNF